LGTFLPRNGAPRPAQTEPDEADHRHEGDGGDDEGVIAKRTRREPLVPEKKDGAGAEEKAD